MTTIPDNYSQYEAYERKEAEYISRLPFCVKCGERCEVEGAHDWGEGPYCADCAADWWDSTLIDLDEFVEDTKKEEW